MVNRVVQALYIEVSWEYPIFETFNVFLALLALFLTLKSRDEVRSHFVVLLVPASILWALRLVKCLRGVPDFDDVTNVTYYRSRDLIYTEELDVLTQVEVTTHYWLLLLHIWAIVILQCALVRIARSRRHVYYWPARIVALVVSLLLAAVYINFDDDLASFPGYVFVIAAVAGLAAVFVLLFPMFVALRGGRGDDKIPESDEPCIVNAKYRLLGSILAILINVIGPVFLTISLALNVFIPTIPEDTRWADERRRVYEHMHLWTGFTIHPYFLFFAFEILHPTFRSAFLPCFRRSRTLEVPFRSTNP